MRITAIFLMVLVVALSLVVVGCGGSGGGRSSGLPLADVPPASSNPTPTSGHGTENTTTTTPAPPVIPNLRMTGVTFDPEIQFEQQTTLISVQGDYRGVTFPVDIKIYVEGHVPSRPTTQWNFLTEMKTRLTIGSGNYSLKAPWRLTLKGYETIRARADVENKFREPDRSDNTFVIPVPPLKPTPGKLRLFESRNSNTWFLDIPDVQSFYAEPIAGNVVYLTGDAPPFKHPAPGMPLTISSTGSVIVSIPTSVLGYHRLVLLAPNAAGQLMRIVDERLIGNPFYHVATDGTWNITVGVGPYFGNIRFAAYAAPDYNTVRPRPYVVGEDTDESETGNYYTDVYSWSDYLIVNNVSAHSRQLFTPASAVTGVALFDPPHADNQTLVGAVTATYDWKLDQLRVPLVQLDLQIPHRLNVGIQTGSTTIALDPLTFGYVRVGTNRVPTNMWVNPTTKQFAVRWFTPPYTPLNSSDWYPARQGQELGYVAHWSDIYTPIYGYKVESGKIRIRFSTAPSGTTTGYCWNLYPFPWSSNSVAERYVTSEPELTITTTPFWKFMYVNDDSPHRTYSGIGTIGGPRLDIAATWANDPGSVTIGGVPRNAVPAGSAGTDPRLVGDAMKTLSIATRVGETRLRLSTSIALEHLTVNTVPLIRRTDGTYRLYADEFGTVALP